MRLRPLEPTDRAALGLIADQLVDPAHDGGRNALVAVADDGAIAGVAGWVSLADAREFFGSPLRAHARDAADALIDALVERARTARAAWIRSGVDDGESHTRDALIARGFVPRFDFVTVACTAAPREAAAPAGLVRVPLASVDPAVLCALHDGALAGVDNAGPMSLDEARQAQAHAWPDASGVWMDGDRAAAFAVVVRAREPVDHVLIDVIGVGAAWRRRGIARALVDRTVDLAARAGTADVRALIASTNAASLALHEAAGFFPVRRRPIYQLDL